MSDYLLFVDTETSGWPKDWRKSYAAEDNWPYVVQVAWIIYDRNGREIKAENHFISNDDFSISPTSQKIHGITREFLRTHGKDREGVLGILSDDLNRYQPLVVGYFTQLDYHVLSAEFYRLGRKSPFTALPLFCVMKAAALYSYFPHRRYLSLDRLYEKLFHTSLVKHHDAYVDAQATARCFFELRQQGRIGERLIAQQQQSETVAKVINKQSGATVFLFLLLLLLLFVVLYWYQR